MQQTVYSKPVSSVKAQFDLSGKTALVTGGAGFLGGYFAEAVAEMGAIPLVVDIDEKQVKTTVGCLQEKHYPAEGFTLDITDPKHVAELVSEIEIKYRRLDILINSAAFAMRNLQGGGDDFFAAFENYDSELWQVSIDVNLTGTFLVTQAVGRVMKGQKRGVVINIASDVAVISPDHRIYEPDERFGFSGVPFNTPAAYSVSKAGVLSLTRYLATYWAKDGIRVNAISPAGVYRGQDPKFVEQLSFRIPMGRMAYAEELKGPVVFLASDASSFITGANLIVDGGRTVW